MENDIDWSSIPGLTWDVIKELVKLPAKAGAKALEYLEKVPRAAANVTANSVRTYRGDLDTQTDKNISVETLVSGTSKPENNTEKPELLKDTFASEKGGPLPQKEVETFAAGSDKQVSSVESSSVDKEVEDPISDEDFVSAFTKEDGSFLSKEDINKMSDEEKDNLYTKITGFETNRDKTAVLVKMTSTAREKAQNIKWKEDMAKRRELYYPSMENNPLLD